MKRMSRRSASLRALALAQGLLLVVAGCKSPSGQGTNTGVTRQALVGKDGARTVSTATTVNSYSALANDATAGTASVTVAAISDLASAEGTDGGLQPLAAGDLLLIIQMAGATISAADTATGGISDYGSVTALNNAGNYELAGVASISGKTITLACSLQKSYTVTGKTQVIRVPQYTTLTINSGGSITAPAWNGTVGGVVAVQAATTLQLDGTIDVSATGFRGGATHQGANSGTADQPTYRCTSSVSTTDQTLNCGGQKGESIAGAPADYDSLFSGQLGRGAPANGGGGGNWHNGGGGGGANAAAIDATDAASDLIWNGQGVMAHSVANDALAWALDDGYALNDDFTNSPGGGRGGYTYSANDQDATTDGPGNADWGGNYRRERGGLGGHPLTSSTGGAGARLFLGGGGGSGDGNNGFTGPGGNGGGLAFVIAGTVQGTGSILANGADGGPANSGTATSGDGPGGGGGGGTVVVHAAALSGITVAANGGKGGNQHLAGVPEAEGPGGGGGGGYVALSGGTPAAVSADPGVGGTTDSIGLTEFPSNGATAGHVGIVDDSAATILYCTSPTTVIATYPHNPTNVTAGAFTFTSPESGVSFSCNLDSTGYAACSASYTTPALNDGSHTLNVQATDINGNVGATATYTWTVDTVPPDTFILSGPNDPSSSSTAHFIFSSDESGEAGEAGITFWCGLDDSNPADFAACPADYTINGLADGSHTLYVSAKDAAGNLDPSPAAWPWTVHATGLDGGVEDAGSDAQAIDGALVFEDASGPDTAAPAADGPGTVVFADAAADVVVAVDLAAPNRDAPAVSTPDAAADMGVLEDASEDVGALAADAQIVVVDARSVDVAATPDQAVLPVVPDAAIVTIPDAAVAPTPDAPVVTGTPKEMGSGFCAVNPVRDSAPGLFTFFLVGAFGLLLRRRRR
jgi:hypothetical protein